VSRVLNVKQKLNFSCEGVIFVCILNLKTFDRIQKALKTIETYKTHGIAPPIKFKNNSESKIWAFSLSIYIYYS
jgi:hypothetical protein